MKLPLLAGALTLSYNSSHLQGRETTMSICLVYGCLGNSFFPSFSVSDEPLLYAGAQYWICISLVCSPFSSSVLYIKFGAQLVDPCNLCLSSEALILWICSQKATFTLLLPDLYPCSTTSSNRPVCVQNPSLC